MSCKFFWGLNVDSKVFIFKKLNKKTQIAILFFPFWHSMETAKKSAKVLRIAQLSLLLAKFMRMNRSLLFVLFALWGTFLAAQEAPVDSMDATVEAPVKVERDSTNYRIVPSIINLPLKISTHRIRKIIGESMTNPLSNGEIKQNMASLVAVDGVNGVLGKAGDAIESIPWVGTLFGKARQTVSENLWTPLVDAVRNSVERNVPLEALVKYNVYYDDSWIKIVGNHMIADIYLSFDLNVDAVASGVNIGVAACGINEMRPQLKITIGADLSWLNEAKLQMDNKQWYLEWTRPCTMTIFNLEMESLLGLPGIKNMVANTIDKYMKESLPNDVSVRDFLVENWDAMTAPQEIPVEDMGTQAWLQINAFGLTFGPIWGENDTLLNTIVSIYASPTLIFGEKPEQSPRPLPPIYVNNQPDNSFKIFLTVGMPLEKAEEALGKQLEDPEVIATMPEKLKITKLRLYGTGDGKCAIGLTLKKPFKGELFLEGQPIYNPEQNELSFGELDFTLRTKNVFVKTAGWLFHEKVKKKLSEALVTNLASPMQDIMLQIKNMEVPLNEFAALKSTVNALTVRDIWFTRNEIKVLVEASGTAYLDVK